MENLSKDAWNARYLDGTDKWDLGAVSPPLKVYIDSLKDKSIRILIPGCGNAYEAAYLWELGFHDVFVLDWAPEPLKAFADKHSDFPKENLICDDFFSHQGQYDLVLEQTFFCAIDPSLRNAYVSHMCELLKPGGRLVGLLFDHIFEEAGPPFGGTREEYRSEFAPFLTTYKMETAINSVGPRAGRELFIDLRKDEK